MTIAIPENVAARVSLGSDLSNNINTRGPWQKESVDRYVLAGDGPEISIEVDLGSGNLRLRTE